MYKHLLMLTFCLTAQSIDGKSLFDYNVNPEYDLIADESSTSYTNFWPFSKFYGSPVTRSKHQINNIFGNTGHGFGTFPNPFQQQHGGHFVGHSPEECIGNNHALNFHGSQLQPFHGLPPVHNKQYIPPHEQPNRFPPQPVYDANFIMPPTTARPFFAAQRPITTPAGYVAPKLTTSRAAVRTTPRATPRTTAVRTTTRATTRRTTVNTVRSTTSPPPPSSTTSNKQLMYDIDVRFGSD